MSGPVFSNGTHFGLFYERWCARCTRDQDIEDGGDGCEVLRRVASDEPAPEIKADGNVVDDWNCSAFEEAQT